MVPTPKPAAPEFESNKMCHRASPRLTYTERFLSLHGPWLRISAGSLRRHRRLKTRDKKPPKSFSHEFGFAYCVIKVKPALCQSLLPSNEGDHFLSSMFASPEFLLFVRAFNEVSTKLRTCPSRAERLHICPRSVHQPLCGCCVVPRDFYTLGESARDI